MINWTDQLMFVYVLWEYYVVLKEMIDFHEILIVLQIHVVEMYYPKDKKFRKTLLLQKKI
jgi:hypothetical protein